jgi:hypothetical protein
MPNPVLRHIEVLLPLPAVYTDAATAVLTLTPSSTDLAETVDADTGILTLTPDGSDQFVSANEDADTVILAFTPSSTDLIEAVETGTAVLALTPSSTEVFESVDSDTVLLTFTITYDEQFPIIYTDAGELDFHFTIDACELYVPSYSDLSISGEERWIFDYQNRIEYEGYERWELRLADAGEIAECR